MNEIEKLRYEAETWCKDYHRVFKELGGKLGQARETLEWYASSLNPETRLSDNGERAEKTLKAILCKPSTH